MKLFTIFELYNIIVMYKYQTLTLNLRTVITLLVSRDSCCNRLLKNKQVRPDLRCLCLLTYPVWLRGSPLYLVDLPLSGRVGQDGILDGAGHLLDVPDESLMIVSRGADVTGGVRGPGDTVNTGPVVVQSGHWSAGHPDVQDDHLGGVHGHGGKIVGVLFVPGQSEERSVSGVLVYDGAVLQVSQVEHPHTPVRPNTGEHVPAAPRLAEGDIVDLLVVGDQLGLDVARDHVDPAEDLTGLEAPDCAGGVDGRSSQQVGIHLSKLT